MVEIRHVQDADRSFWQGLDRRLPDRAFAEKVRDRTGYVLLENGVPAGLLRYNLFWDEIPFCNLLLVEESRRGRGFGRGLMARWEADMAAQGFALLMTSTRADESAQHFYRRLGYQDGGCLLLHGPAYQQAAELFLTKHIP